MVKKLISCVLVVAVAAFVPAAMLGCHKNEVKTHKQVEVRDQVIQQDTVVQ